MQKKGLILILAATFFVAWGLGILRFSYPWIEVLFDVVLFPFGFIYMMLEHWSMAYLNSSHFFRNEFVEIILFALLSFAQGYTCYLIYSTCKKKWEKKAMFTEAH
ncbi:MAG: hypothetical protein LBL18_02480 [Bacteroidales bacterium]|jgi:hypothetical protein|nr:hypothetical protein [Bacteroidales bacterium]